VTKRLNMISAMVFAMSATASLAQTALAEPPEATPASAQVANFTLVDQAGTTQELYSHDKAPIIVIATQVNGDPISHEAINTLAYLKGIFGQADYFLLNSSSTDTKATIAAEASALNVAVPVLDDDHQVVARNLGVTQTGEAYVIDPIGWKILYHGPVNAAAAKDPSESFLLFNAMVYAMSHRQIDTPVVEVKGTPIALNAN
jgi:hypothetical protein